MSMQEWAAKVAKRHEAEVVEGLHDNECEWRANGHYLCLCSKRRRIAAGYTEPPGDLIFNDPSCPRCGEDVPFDGDGWTCSPCNATWTNATGDAYFNDDHGDLDIARWDAAKAAQAGAAQA